MIIDQNNQFASAVSVANAAGTALIGNVIDLTTTVPMEGHNIGLVIVVTTGITVASSTGKVRFQLASGTVAAVPTDGTAAVMFQTGDFATSTTAIPAGTVLFAGALPKQSGVYNSNNRYLGILEVVTTTTINAGAISAFLVEDVGRWTALPTVTN